MSAQQEQQATDSRPTPASAAPDTAAPGPARRDAAPAADDASGADAGAARADAAPPALEDDADDEDDASSPRPAPQRRPRGRDGRYARAVRSYPSLDASLHDFRDELSAIADDVGYLLRNESVVNPELKAQLEQRFERLRGTVAKLADEALEAGDRLRIDVEDRVHARIDASRTAIEERPITSVVMAAVIGVSVGMLLSRRR